MPSKRKYVRIIFIIIIILYFDTTTGNKSYLSAERNINFPFLLTSFVIYSEEPLFIEQSAFHSVPLPAITRRKESKDRALPHFTDLTLLSFLRSSSLQQMIVVPDIFLRM